MICLKVNPLTYTRVYAYSWRDSEANVCLSEQILLVQKLFTAAACDNAFPEPRIDATANSLAGMSTPEHGKMDRQDRSRVGCVSRFGSL